MDWQLLTASVAFGVTAIIAALMATGILPGSTAVIDAWISARPTVPRRWLAAAFWTSLVLPIVACGLLVGTGAQVLSGVWSDAAQFLLWLALAVDAVVVRRRLLLAVAAVFLGVSGYAVAVRL